MSTHTTPWWQKREGADLENRIKRINEYRDTTTSTDELLRVARVFLAILLLFSGALAGMNYFLFFSHTLPFEFALGASALLTSVIEWGKSRMGLRAFQKPFLEGFGTIVSTPAQTIMWTGTVLFALATFTMSIMNSTKGGEAMAAKMGREKHESVFVPDTKFYDDQIAAATTIQQQHSNNKWKGTIVYKSAQVADRQGKTIVKLSEDRQKAIDQQRADWERNRDAVGQETSTAAAMVLKAGGWVELLQLLLIIIIASCQKVLADKMGGSPTPATGIGFRLEASGYHPATGSGPDERRPIGFHRAHDTAARTSRPETPPYSVESVAVSQVSQPVSQFSTVPESVGAGEALRHIRTDLMRDVNNLEKQHGAVATILKRMEACLWKAIQLHATPDFAPGVHNYQIFCQYIFGDFTDKMIVLESNCEDEDKAHYSFLRTNRTDALKKAVTEFGAKTNIVQA